MTSIPITPKHVLNEKARNELKRVNSTAILDVLVRNGFDPKHIYMPNLTTLTPGLRLVARAITVRFVPFRSDLEQKKPDGEDSPEYAAFEIAGPGDVIAMEAMQTKLMSVGGDIKLLRLMQRGVDGLITDGGIRDMHIVREYGIGIWSYGKTSNQGSRVGIPYSTNDTINVDNVAIEPGDYIVADDDGVVIIPREKAIDIHHQALEYDRFEDWVKNNVEDKKVSPSHYYRNDNKTMEQFRKYENNKSGI